MSDGRRGDERDRPLDIEAVEQRLRRAPRRFLVTGAAGFVGSHLVERLLALGQEVRALDDFSTGSRANLEDVRRRVADGAWARFELHEGSVVRAEDVARACAGVNVVLHQAALGSVPRSLADPLATFEVNVTGSARLLEAARAAGVRRFVFASSSSVYGDDERQPRVEDRLGEPLSPYAASKRMGELWARAAFTAHGFETVGLRYFNLFGPRQDPAGPYAAVIPRWIDALRAGRAPELHGDGSTSRDFCPVANAVQANLLAAVAGGPVAGRCFNVGLGGRVTLARLLETLTDGLERRGVACAQRAPIRGPFRPGDVRHSQADLSAAGARLGYRPRMGFEEGIAWTLDRTLQRDAAPAPRA